MLSKCANPVCSAPFRYLGDGRLFQVELQIVKGSSKPVRKIEHFWLCDPCSQQMRVAVADNEAVLVQSDPEGNVIRSTPIESVHAA